MQQRGCLQRNLRAAILGGLPVQLPADPVDWRFAAAAAVAVSRQQGGVLVEAGALQLIGGLLDRLVDVEQLARVPEVLAVRGCVSAMCANRRRPARDGAVLVVGVLLDEGGLGDAVGGVGGQRGLVEELGPAAGDRAVAAGRGKVHPETEGRRFTLLKTRISHSKSTNLKVELLLEPSLL